MCVFMKIMKIRWKDVLGVCLFGVLVVNRSFSEVGEFGGVEGSRALGHGYTGSGDSVSLVIVIRTVLKGGEI